METSYIQLFGMEEKQHKPLPTKAYIKKEEYFFDEDSPLKLQSPKFFRKRIEEKISEQEKRLQELSNELKSIEEKIESKKKELEELEDKIVEKAQERAEEIINEAEEVAFKKIKSSLEEKDRNLEEAEQERQKIIQKGKEEAERIIQEAIKEGDKIKKEAYEKGFSQGIEDGFRKGQDEIRLLVNRLHDIVSYIVNRRTEIIEKSEREVVEMALEITKKVLKEITENQKEIVVNQIKYGLSKLIGSTTVIIKVNPRDFEIATQHKEEFIRLLESNPNLKIFEDPLVNIGGCIIETDTTSLDLEVMSQFEEIQSKIRSMLP